MSYVEADDSYHLTDRHTETTEIIYHAALQVVNKYSPCSILDSINTWNWRLPGSGQVVNNSGSPVLYNIRAMKFAYSMGFSTM